MSIQVSIVPVTQYQQNCSVMKCLKTGKAAIVDHGGDIERIKQAMSEIERPLKNYSYPWTYGSLCSV